MSWSSQELILSTIVICWESMKRHYSIFVDNKKCFARRKNINYYKFTILQLHHINGTLHLYTWVKNPQRNLFHQPNPSRWVTRQTESKWCQSLTGPRWSRTYRECKWCCYSTRQKWNSTWRGWKWWWSKQIWTSWSKCRESKWCWSLQDRGEVVHTKVVE